MILRSTWHGRMSAMATAAGRIGVELGKVNEQIATGKDINRPSDDPAKIAQLHAIRQELENQTVYTSNAGQTEQLLNVADTAISELHATLVEGREAAMQFANETYTASQRADSAQMVDNLREQALSLANTRYEERYIFAGTQYDAEAYDSTGTYQGGTDAPEVVVGSGITAQTGFDGSDLLTGSSDMFGALSDLSTALTANDIPGIRDAMDALDLALLDVEGAMVEVGGEMRRATDSMDLAENLKVELSGAKANLEEADVIEAYSRLIQLQTNFDAAMQAAAVQQYSGLFALM
jgi:flagellar hook-associated protein 3 FlgL